MPKSRGPIVCCLDVSGSMNFVNGSKPFHQWGQEFAFGLLAHAHANNREFCFIAYAEEVKTVLRMPVGAPDTIDMLNEIIALTGHNITSLRPALKAAAYIATHGDNGIYDGTDINWNDMTIDMFCEGAEVDADIVVVTDELEFNSLRARTIEPDSEGRTWLNEYKSICDNRGVRLHSIQLGADDIRMQWMQLGSSYSSKDVDANNPFVLANKIIGSYHGPKPKLNYEIHARTGNCSEAYGGDITCTSLRK